MPRGKAAADSKTETPKKRGRRKRRARGPTVGFAPFILFAGGPRRKPKAISTFYAAKGKVAALVKRGADADSIGLYQRRKVKVEQVVKI